MSYPDSSAVHVDAALTNIAVAFIQNTQHFVAHRVFQNVAVDKQSDRYFVYDRGDFNRDTATKRAPATESSGSGFDIDNTPTYFADVWAHHKDVAWQLRANADRALQLDRAATIFTMQKLLIRKERDWASNYFTTGKWATDITGVASSPTASQAIYWSDFTSGTPIENIRAAKTAVLKATGFEPNVLTLGAEVFAKLEDHPDIVDRIKYSGGVGNGNPAKVNANTLAQLFDLDEVIVSKAIYNSAAQGLTEVSNFIGGKNALLSYRPPAPGLMVPAAGYTFSWEGYLNAGNEYGIAISRFAMDLKKADRIEGEIAMAHKLVSSELGYFWSGIVA